MARHHAMFTNVDTAADDTCLLAFTSGTTGVPKATMHFHRDVMAACACWPPHVLRAEADDVFIGSPPLAFTFGLGGLLLFPMSMGASTVLLEKAGPNELLAGPSPRMAPRCCSPRPPRTAPWRRTAVRCAHDWRCASACRPARPAGRHPRAVEEATGIELIDGIGATELLHIFISADEAHARPAPPARPWCPATAPAWWTTRAAVPPGRWASWP
jgi:2-aminobenzoate-CoA ligase